MIRWVTPVLGTAPADSPEIDPSMAVVDVRDLVDKQGNTSDLVRTKIEQGVALLRDGRRVVVCCDYGISRSNSVAAGILARFTPMTFDLAVREVQRATGENEIKLEPLNAVRAALDDARHGGHAAGLRVLVTGGSGFLGAALRAKLEGEAVAVVSPTREQADLVSGAVGLDLLVKEQGINCLVHLANPRVYTSTRAMGDTLTMMRNVLDVCRENRVRLVYPSGWEVYSGYRTRDLIADESVPLLPGGVYGETKVLCETVLNHYRRRHDLEVVVVRSSAVYGAGGARPKFINSFLTKARAGAPIHTHEYANGLPHLDLLHIDDAVAALVAAARGATAGDFNVGTGVLTSTYDVAAALVAKVGSSSPIATVRVNDSAPNVRMDYAKASAVWGWRPTRSLDVGLDEITSLG